MTFLSPTVLSNIIPSWHILPINTAPTFPKRKLYQNCTQEERKQACATEQKKKDVRGMAVMLTYLRISFESTSCRLVGCCEMRRWLDFYSNTANYVEVFSGSDSKSEIRGRKKRHRFSFHSCWHGNNTTQKRMSSHYTCGIQDMTITVT